MDIETQIRYALEEDCRDAGDITSDAIFSDEYAEYKLIAKDSGIICGIDVFKKVFAIVDPKIQVRLLYKDGDEIKSFDVISEITGPIKGILKAERTALNFISHLSAVATKTALFVSESHGIRILDTRKTIPGLRDLQKYAVKTGGGENHRIGLYDMVMIKDNHIDGCGSITKAVEKVRQKWGDRYKVEVETRTLEEVNEALSCNVDRIMLDNMDNETMTRAVVIINKKAEVEASGNMTLERLKTLSGTGIDFVSFGELTHTIKVFDFSLVKQ